MTEMSTSALEVFLRRLDEFVPRGSQERIAGLAGLASETISRWKNRHTVPDLVSIEALAQAIDVPLVNLVTETASSEQMDACIDLLNESGRQLEIAGQRLRADAERMRRRAPRPQKAHEP